MYKYLTYENSSKTQDFYFLIYYTHHTYICHVYLF